MIATLVSPTVLDAAWHMHDAVTPRGRGGVFTPRALALRLAERTLSFFKDAPRVIDPACGAGALLLGALEFAARERPDWLEPWARGGLAGWELDSATTRAARRVLRAALRGLDLPPHDLVSARNGLQECDCEFDAVLTNPPWVSFSGRQAAMLPRARRNELARRFAAFRGWPSLHAAFCEQAARLAPGGRIGLLLPMQIADLAGYGAARAALTAGHGLEAVHDLGERAFEGVTEPCGMFIFGAQTGTGWLPREDTLLQRTRRFSPLPAASFGDIGVHTGNAAKWLLRDKPAKGLRPLRVGADVRAFELAKPTLWLRDGKLPAGKTARVPDAAAFKRVRIVLRQTANRPIAARHRPAHAFRNSLLACYGAPGHDDDFLLAVLNSEIMARIHRAMFRDARQRAFPQVKIAHLRALPMPGPKIGPAYGRIAELSRRVQAGDASARVALEEAIGLVFDG